jgi:hypothetical protein
MELMRQLLRALYDPTMAQPRTLEPEEWELWDTWMRAQRLLARELERGSG